MLLCKSHEDESIAHGPVRELKTLTHELGVLNPLQTKPRPKMCFYHCEKYPNFNYFSGVENFWKRAARFRKIFNPSKLCKITVIYKIYFTFGSHYTRIGIHGKFLFLSHQLRTLKASLKLTSIDFQYFVKESRHCV